MLIKKKKQRLLAVILLTSKECFIFYGILTIHKRLWILQLAAAFALTLVTLSGVLKC